MNDIYIKRDEVSQAYSSKHWKQKVAKMSDKQVLAIYFRMKKEGKIK